MHDPDADAVPPLDHDVLEEEDEVEEEEEVEGEEQEEVVRLCRLMSNTVFLGFEAHVKDLERARARRREVLAFKSAVEEGVGGAEEGADKQSQDEIDGLGVWMPGDKYQGDVNYRTLQKLLARVDARGFERSAQQLEFHVVSADRIRLELWAHCPCEFALWQAFMKAAARVVYKGGISRCQSNNITLFIDIRSLFQIGRLIAQ